MVTAMGSLVSCAAAADHADNKISNDEMIYLFPFFRGNGQHGVFLAAGDDGYHFKPINNDEPIMTPADWDGQRLTRDPSIIWDEQNEIFRMVWTSNWSGEVFGYAESNDGASR